MEETSAPIAASLAAGEAYAPASLAQEGFLHASYADRVWASARLYLPTPGPGQRLVALQIDPRRLEVKIVVVSTPRGPMPHIHGPIAAQAVHAVVALDGKNPLQDGVS